MEPDLPLAMEPDLPLLTREQLEAVEDLDGFRALLAVGNLTDADGNVDQSCYGYETAVSAMVQAGFVQAFDAIVATKTVSALQWFITDIVWDDYAEDEAVEYLMSIPGLSPLEGGQEALYYAAVQRSVKLFDLARRWIDRAKPHQSLKYLREAAFGKPPQPYGNKRNLFKCIVASGLEMLCNSRDEVRDLRRRVAKLQRANKRLKGNMKSMSADMESMRASVASIAHKQGGSVARVDLPAWGGFQDTLDALAYHPDNEHAGAAAEEFREAQSTTSGDMRLRGSEE
jgi:hypothetical protein